MSPEKEPHTVVHLGEGCTLVRRGASLELSTPRVDGSYLLADLAKPNASGASLGRWEAEIEGLPALRARVELEPVEAALRSKDAPKLAELATSGTAAQKERAVEALQTLADAPGASAADYERAGLTAAHLRLAGRSLAQCKDAGVFSSAAEARQAGYSCAEAKQAGYSCAEAKQAGWTLFEFHNQAGYSWQEAKA